MAAGAAPVTSLLYCGSSSFGAVGWKRIICELIQSLDDISFLADVTDVMSNLCSPRQGEPKKPPVRGQAGGGRAQGWPRGRGQGGEEQPTQQ